MKSITALLSAAIALMMAQTIIAADLGDPAAPLQIAEWAKGGPVDLAALKGKQVAVVEFWATWCPPCRESIPHLTELQKKFKDVVFVGVSDEDAATVKKFVAKMGDTMDYHVAVDDGEKTSDGFMKAYNIDSIPHAFVVGEDGNVLWEGHPMEGLEETLQQIAAGTYDISKAKKRAQAQAKLEQFVQLASQDDKDPKLGPLGKELEALDQETGGIQPGEKFDAAEVIRMVNFEKLERQYGKAVMTGQGQEQLDALAAGLRASSPTNFDLGAFRNDVAEQKAFTDYYQAAAEGSDKDTLSGLAQKVAATKSKNAPMLNQMALAILTDEHFQTRDYALAATLARASVDASDAKATAALDTYARALFESGKVADAVTWEKKAVAASTSDDERKPSEEALKKYEDAGSK